jgi:hypothetical protein
MKTDNTNPDRTQAIGQAALSPFAGLATSAALTRRDAAAPDWRGYCFPPPDETGFVPNEDGNGTVLAVARPDGGPGGLDYYYAPRTRAFHALASIQAGAFVRTVKSHAREAAHMTAALKARALFWEYMARAPALDAERGL